MATWWLRFWVYSAYFAWLFLCIAFMIIWQIKISIQYRNSHMRGVVSRTYDKVYLYPVAMIVCWTLNFWCDDVSPGAGKTLNATSMIFGISNGIFAAIIFMTKSEEARRRWTAYLFPVVRSKFDEAVEPEIPLDFDEAELEFAHSMNSMRSRSSSSSTRDTMQIAMTLRLEEGSELSSVGALSLVGGVVGKSPIHQ